jgi:hypothetical protein
LLPAWRPAAAFFTTAFGAGLAAAFFATGLAAAFFTGAALLAAFFTTGAFLLAAAGLALAGAAAFFATGLVALTGVFFAVAFLAAGCEDAALVAGLLAFLATGFAANFFTTGLAVFLAAVAAFFAVFLAATKRSSLDSPGPGKAGLYSLPDPQQQPRHPAPFSPGAKAPKGQSDEHGPPCAVRNLASTRGAGTGRRPSATCDQRPILHKCGLHANWHKMTG